MKSKNNWLKIAVIISVIGFMIGACDDDSNKTGKNEQSNKTDPTVTWPSGITAIMGQTLSDISLASFTNTIPGVFSWVTPTANVGSNVNQLGTRSHNMRFTPTDTSVYNTVTNSVNITVRLAEMVPIQGGFFRMGSPSTEIDRFNNENYRTANNGFVTVNGFSMGKYEVTQEQYQAVTGNNPSHHFSNPASGEIQIKRPVERITWYDAIEFCNKLSVLEGLEPVYTIIGRTPATGYPITNATVLPDWNKNGYRLPTEAEWEYACRAGTTTRWYFGEHEYELINYAWFSINSNERTHQIGLKQPNSLGLYDMHGNVWEWCWDSYAASYNNAGGSDNPRGAVSGDGFDRVIRGGDWSHQALFARSAYRSHAGINYRGGNLGIRLARN